MTNLDLSQLDPTNLTRIVIDLNAQRLAQIDPALPELMRACAIPVSFNAEIVSQLISVSASQPDSAAAGQPSASQFDAATALSHLLTLPFIIQRQDGDYAYHDSSRNFMLADWQNDRPRYMEYVSRLVTYYEQQGKQFYERKEYETALTWFNLALELQPTGILYNWRGRTHVRLGNYAAAVTDLTQTIQQQAADADTYFDLGTAHYYLNNTQASLTALSEVIRLNPQIATAYYNRGNLHKNLGQTDFALADYNEAIRLTPQYASVYNNRGLLYHEKLGQIDLALADYTEAIRLNPQYASAYYNRGNSYDDLGQTDRALADYTEAIRLNPHDDAAYNNRAILYKKLGHHEAALADYAEAIRLNPQNAMAYSNRANFYLQQKLFDLALKDCDQSIQISSQYAPAYYNRACAWALQGQIESALRDLRQAFELDKAQGSTEHVTLAQTDSDFDSLRELPAFQALLAEFGGATANEEKSE